jgi:hypothetical protein
MLLSNLSPKNLKSKGVQSPSGADSRKERKKKRASEIQMLMLGDAERHQPQAVGEGRGLGKAKLSEEAMCKGIPQGPHNPWRLSSPAELTIAVKYNGQCCKNQVYNRILHWLQCTPSNDHPGN